MGVSGSQGPGERHRVEPGRRHPELCRQARRLAGAHRLARRDLCQKCRREARRLPPPWSPPSAATRAAGGKTRPGRRRGGHRSHTTRGSPSCGPSARAGRRACGSSSRTPTGPRRALGSLPGRRVAALLQSPHARLHARGRLLAAQAPRGRDRLAGVPRARRRHREPPCTTRRATCWRCCPRRRRFWEAGARRWPASTSRRPTGSACAPTTCREDQPGDKAQVARPCRCSRQRARWCSSRAQS